MDIVNLKLEKSNFYIRYKKSCITFALAISSLFIAYPIHYEFNLKSESLTTIAQKQLESINPAIKSFHCNQVENKSLSTDGTLRVCDITLNDGNNYQQHYKMKIDKANQPNLNYSFNDEKLLFSTNDTMTDMFFNHGDKNNLPTAYNNTVMQDIKSINDFLNQDKNIEKEVKNYNLWNKQNAH